MTFIDATTIDKSEWQADICIIGAGAAGITLAESLKSNSALETILVEAGALEAINQHNQETYQGSFSFETIGGKEKVSNQGYLRGSRLKVFGGTTQHWSNWCVPLDPIDFEKREWVPDSGWPISLDDLDAYYPEAAKICSVPDVLSREFVKPIYKIGEGRNFKTQQYSIAPTATRFGNIYKDSLGSSAIKVLYNATATSLILKDSQRVEYLRLLTPDRKELKVKARLFVLACGGLENPRLLLHSVQSDGRVLGNENDLVGRFFAEHPHFNFGRVVLTDTDREQMEYYNAFLPNSKIGVFCLTESAQRKHKLLNTQFDLDPIGTAKLPGSDRHAAEAVFRFRSKTLAQDSYLGGIRFILEPTPNRDSRVTLGSEKDFYGMQRIAVNYRFTELDKHTIKTSLELLRRDLGTNFSGKVKFENQEAFESKEFFNSAFVQFGHHHLGTTRMSDSASSGVVDKDCKVFGTSNLFIAGSSVFKTAGHAAPTLTIVSLALRLADHLKGLG